MFWVFCIGFFLPRAQDLFDSAQRPTPPANEMEGKFDFSALRLIYRKNFTTI